MKALRNLIIHFFQKVTEFLSLGLFFFFNFHQLDFREVKHFGSKIAQERIFIPIYEKSGMFMLGVVFYSVNFEIFNELFLRFLTSEHFCFTELKFLKKFCL